jgi:hypothetical protein
LMQNDCLSGTNHRSYFAAIKRFGKLNIYIGLYHKNILQEIAVHLNIKKE